ncbi:Pirin [hydrothermal vent metagenome]|uniref:Pirin n=1 Tax=hydrothermal vent metagenome TaxID=652676 RepID=A0A3B1DK36_9ZZZZ
MQIRKIKKVMQAKPVIEGAGVRLKRVFGHPEVPEFDPFLLMDDFHSDSPEDYMAGFPMHPHRGIETITYLLQGSVAHRDSMGNEGRIEAGDIQWMTAGSGIIHEEMPEESKPALWGFQLWANLPATHKMMPPRYQNIKAAEVPEFVPEAGVSIKVICGALEDVKGPVQEIVTDPEYLDIRIGVEKVFEHRVKAGHTVFAYVIEGEAAFAEEASQYTPETLVLFDAGDVIRVRTGENPVRFLLISGKPIGEPVAWRGPIVMNTQAELDAALKAYQNGTFIEQV